MEEADAASRGRRHADGPVVGLTGARFGGAAGRRSRAAAEPTEINDAGAGLSGAQFPSALSRWWDAGGECCSKPFSVSSKSPSSRQRKPPTGNTRPASNKSPRSRTSHYRCPSRAGPMGPMRVTRPRPRRPTTWCGLIPGPGDEPRRASTLQSRPWSRRPVGQSTLRPLQKHRTILKLCATPHSVAELAALLKMPLGVARVLLGDLAAAGSVAIHRTVGSADVASDVALLQRVLVGLHRL
jgi:hypothetical protein